MLRVLFFNLVMMLVFCLPAKGQSADLHDDYGIENDLPDYFTDEEIEEIRGLFPFLLNDEDLAEAFSPYQECAKEEGDDSTLCVTIKKLILPTITEYCVRGTCFFYDYSTDQWKHAYIAKTEDPSRKLMCEELSNGCPGPK